MPRTGSVTRRLPFGHRVPDARDVVTMPAVGVPPRILSSAHLAEGEWGELSEFEFGLIVSYNAFSRWAVRCMAAAGTPDLTITDVLVLHHVHHRGRAKKLADVCFTLSYEDTHVVNYSLKKLLGIGLLSSEKVGKEVFYALDRDERKGILDRIEAEKIRGKVSVTRFKGLGEMSPQQLRETTMHRDTRRLVRLTIDAKDNTDQLMDMLLAKKRAPDRRNWLETKGNLAEV